MRLALLGADDETLELVRWAVLAARHELVAAYDVDARAADVAAIAPAAQLGGEWESLVLGTQADAVIVSRGQAGLTAATGIADDERRGEQLRKLVQAAIPLLIVCPACEAIVGFEIEMIRRDAGAVIVPLVPGTQNSAIREVVKLVASGSKSPIGAVEQVVVERGLVDRSRASVLTAFARDTAILRQIIGTIRSISATGPAPTPGRDPLGPKPKELPPLANLSVHVGDDEGLAARWSVVPTHGNQHASITLIGTSGTATLQMPAEGEWKLEIAGGEQKSLSFAPEPGFKEALWCLSHQEDPVGQREGAWLSACREQEAADAIDRSLARGRTIELFNEQHTEEESFKGVMAMGGCLLLVGALGVVLLAAIVEGLRLPVRDWAVWRFWPVYLLAPFGVFLVLQLLQLLVKKETPGLPRMVGEDRA
jgi:hypothetical protein